MGAFTRTANYASASVIAASCALVISPLALDPHARSATMDPVSPTMRAQLVAARNAVWTAWFKGDSVTLGKLLTPAVAAG